MANIQFDIHREIVERAASGNRVAQKELYHLYCKAMFNICCRMMTSKSEAEDMLQEVFIEAFSRLHLFRNESTFGAWLKRITINKCINELKRKKLELVYSEYLPDLNSQEIEFDLDDSLMTVERIKHAMALLSDGYRVVFSLFLIEGYDHQEIASILGISESTSKTQLMRAKIKVQEILNVGRV